MNSNERRRACALLFALIGALGSRPATANEVTAFTLIDADSDLPLGPLSTGQVVDLDVVQVANLAVRADTNPATTGSVVFDLDGSSGFRTESAAPYALFGDVAGDYAAWAGAPLLGLHTLTATPYTGAGGTGTAGVPLTIDFEIIDPNPGIQGLFTWEERAASPLTLFEAQGAAVGTSLYVFGGFEDSGLNTTTAAHRFDADTNAWEELASVPSPLTHSPQAVDGDSVYLVGGFEGDHPGQSVAAVHVYDTLGDSWSASTPLPADRGGGGVARVGRTLHFFSGATRTQGSNVLTDQADHWTLDLGPTESTSDDAVAWIARAPLPNPRNHLGGVAVNGVVYAVGGQHGGNEGSGNQASLHAYDPVADAWTPRADMPLPRGHTTASTLEVDGQILVIGGVTNGSLEIDAVTAYDPASDTWISLPELPGNRQSPVAGTVGDQILVTGGYDGAIHTTTWAGIFPGEWDVAAGLPLALGEVAGGIIGDLLFLVGEGSASTLAYHLDTGSWESPGSRATRPLPGHHHAAEVYAGKLYLLGGLGAGSEGALQIYDPATDSWQLGPPLPFAAGAGASALIDGRIYFAGGIVGASTTTQAAVYDPVAGSWSSVAPLPVGVNHAAHATDGERFFVVGGRSGGNTVSNGFDHLQIYDPDSDLWEWSGEAGSQLAPLPVARGGTGQGLFFDGELHVFGGETLSGAGASIDGVYDRVDVYAPTTNTWRTANPLLTARHGIWPLLHAGRAYLAGGGIASGNSQSTVFETYHFERCGSVCTPESTLLLAGAPLGGSIRVTVAGWTLEVATTPGQGLAEVADAIAAAAHLASAGAVSVQAVGASLRFERALLEGLTVDDVGLGHVVDPPVGPAEPPPASIPALGAAARGVLAVAFVAVLQTLRRRAGLTHRRASDASG